MLMEILQTILATIGLIGGVALVVAIVAQGVR